MLPKAFIKQLASKVGIGIFELRGRYAQDGLVTVHSDYFRADPAFRSAYRRVLLASSGVDPGFEWRVHIALWAARAALRVKGDFAECDVNAGFISSAIMERLKWNAIGRRFYLIDTFAGPVLNQYSQKEVEQGRLILAEEALKTGAYVTESSADESADYPVEPKTA